MTALRSRADATSRDAASSALDSVWEMEARPGQAVSSALARRCRRWIRSCGLYRSPVDAVAWVANWSEPRVRTTGQRFEQPCGGGAENRAEGETTWTRTKCCSASSSIATGCVGAKRDRNVVGWAALGFCFSALALLIVAFLPNTAPQSSTPTCRVGTTRCNAKVAS